MDEQIETVEYRSVDLDGLETRLATDEQGTFEGYACRYGVVDSYGTTFSPGCWAAGGLDGGTFALLRMHNPEEPVGTFTATEDETGLYIRGKFDPTPEGNAARARAVSRSQGELSVGFVRTGVDPDDPDAITAARLVEVSAITARMASQPGAALTSVRAKVQCSRCGKFVQRVKCAGCAERADDTDVETRMAEPPEGSYENLIGDLREAIEDWAQGAFNATGNAYIYVSVEATFPDRVVATVYVGDEDTSWQFPYVYADDVVTLGEPKPVEIVETIQPADADDMDTLSAEDDTEQRRERALALLRLAAV